MKVLQIRDTILHCTALVQRVLKELSDWCNHCTPVVSVNLFYNDEPESWKDGLSFKMYFTPLYEGIMGSKLLFFLLTSQVHHQSKINPQKIQQKDWWLDDGSRFFPWLHSHVCACVVNNMIWVVKFWFFR